VSTGLHAQLDAAVRARLDAAKAAARFGADWIASFYSELDEWRVRTKGGRELVADISAHDDVAGDVARHIADSDPWTVQRHCERDLRVLKRHAPQALTPFAGMEPMCSGCAWTAWCDCVEIRDMAVAYGLLDPAAGE
jgi:hypothetical protein